MENFGGINNSKFKSPWYLLQIVIKKVFPLINTFSNFRTYVRKIVIEISAIKSAEVSVLPPNLMLLITRSWDLRPRMWLIVDQAALGFLLTFFNFTLKIDFFLFPQNMCDPISGHLINFPII